MMGFRLGKDFPEFPSMSFSNYFIISISKVKYLTVCINNFFRYLYHDVMLSYLQAAAVDGVF